MPATSFGGQNYNDYAKRRYGIDIPAQPTSRINEAAATTAGANASIAQGTAAGTYHAPMTQAEQSQSQLALQQLGETTRANQATEGLTRTGQESTAAARAAELAEQARAAQAGEGLNLSKFEQTKADRAKALEGLDRIWGKPYPGQPINPDMPTTQPVGPGEGGDITLGNGQNPGAGVPAVMPPTDQMPAYDPSLENAAYTGARERVGQESAAALKGLKSVMSARGIGGSGIEAQNTRGIFAQGLKNIAGVNADAAAGRADRAYDWQKSMAPLTEQRRQFGEEGRRRDREFAATQAANQQQQRMQALLSLYGMAY